MTQQDFEQLPTSIQREFVLSACEPLLSIRIDREISIELFYSRNGDFFVELYVSMERDRLVSIKSFHFNEHHLHKFLMDIALSTAYEILRNK